MAITFNGNNLRSNTNSLVAATGFSLNSQSKYSKDHFGEVVVHFYARASSAANRNLALIATLPEGFRPPNTGEPIYFPVLATREGTGDDYMAWGSINAAGEIRVTINDSSDVYTTTFSFVATN